MTIRCERWAFSRARSAKHSWANGHLVAPRHSRWLTLTCRQTRSVCRGALSRSPVPSRPGLLLGPRAQLEHLGALRAGGHLDEHALVVGHALADPVQAGVVGAALEDGVRRVDAGQLAHRLHQPGDVALDELVLERQRRGGDDHPLVVEQRGHQVGRATCRCRCRPGRAGAARPRTPRPTASAIAIWPSRCSPPRAATAAASTSRTGRGGGWRWQARAPGHSSQRHRLPEAPAPTPAGCPQADSERVGLARLGGTPAASSSAKVTVQPRPVGDSANRIVRPRPGARRTVVRPRRRSTVSPLPIRAKSPGRAGSRSPVEKRSVTTRSIQSETATSAAAASAARVSVSRKAKPAGEHHARGPRRRDASAEGRGVQPRRAVQGGFLGPRAWWWPRSKAQPVRSASRWVRRTWARRPPRCS